MSRKKRYQIKQKQLRKRKRRRHRLSKQSKNPDDYYSSGFHVKSKAL